MVMTGQRFGLRGTGRGSGPWSHTAAGRLLLVTVPWLGVVPAVVGQGSGPEFSYVAPVTGSGGPSYPYRVGRFEVTKAQFVEFLNDVLASPDTDRGAYLYFDVDSGDVYVHNDVAGASGTNGTGVLLFSMDSDTTILFDPGLRVYEPVSGWATHPVTGVSWHGAVKYCNWRTLIEGWAPEDRVYVEDVASRWHVWRPVTISEAAWSVRDLNAQERTALADLPGFRLPMDGGEGGGQPGPFNEWYQAAALNDTGGYDVYGFGRSLLTPADANYRCSEDPFEDPFDCVVGGTTPVGFFNGLNLLSDAVTSTVDTQNAFGIYDLSGNVWEWMQDQGFTPANRRNRGGSFRSGAQALEVALAAERAATAVSDSTGFRLVQSVPHPLMVTPTEPIELSGPWGGPYVAEEGREAVWRILNAADTAISFDLSSDAPWLAFPLVSASQNLGPGQELFVSGQVLVDCLTPMAVGGREGAFRVVPAGGTATLTRVVRLTLAEPLRFVTAAPLQFTMTAASGVTAPALSLENSSATEVTWSARVEYDPGQPVDVEWLTVNGAAATPPAVLPAMSLTNIAVEIDPTGLVPGVYRGSLLVVDECTGSELEQTVQLTITTPVRVDPPVLPLFEGTCPGPFQPDHHSMTLTSEIGRSVSWRARAVSPVDGGMVDWVLISPDHGLLPSTGAEETVVVETLDAARLLPEGRHLALIEFEELVAGQSVGVFARRVLTLDVFDFVSPSSDSVFVGPSSGVFSPGSFTYWVTHDGTGELPWRVDATEVVIPGEPFASSFWLTVDPNQGVIVNPGGSAPFEVALLGSALSLSPGIYEVLLTITVGAGTDCQSFRVIRLIVGDPHFAVSMVRIPAADVQPFGANYEYRMGTHEVTNQEYATFLTDAYRHPIDDRGLFLLHDALDGTVRLDGDLTILFDATVAGAIQLDPLGGGGGTYVVSAGRERHPVSGVSWIGALKYCNWLTVVQGMTGPDQRAYTEGPTAGDWRPVVVPAAAYGQRDLTDAERESLVQNVRGFRLPMDQGIEGAAPFNEWFKAAAWLPDFNRNAMYGFGRDLLKPSDANYLSSGDPYDEGTTPVGFFGGTGIRTWNDALYGWGTQPPVTFAVEETDNGYGIHDLTGNVAEWVQDAGGQLTLRGTRGGHFGSAEASTLLTNSARGPRPRDECSPQVGFRLVQSVVRGDLTLGQTGLRTQAIVGGAPPAASFSVRLFNDSGQTLDHVSVSTSGGWLAIQGVPPSQLPPRQFVDIPLSIITDPARVGPSPAPPGAFSLIPGSDVQVGGPTYDFWIGRTEVTNANFAEFLNDAFGRANGTTLDDRSDFLYFDLDSGDVYLHFDRPATRGTAAPSSLLTVRAYHAGIGRIQLAGASYVIQGGMRNHPVVGVSWYGALKYCNWRSLQEGLPPALRVYGEAPVTDLAGWRPVVASAGSWAPGAVDSATRDRVVQESPGYRLPMDEERSTASSYNEWYKASSMRGRDGQGVALFDAVYGTGRDGRPSPGEANLDFGIQLSIGGPSAVGMFDGATTIPRSVSVCDSTVPDPLPTMVSENGYSLADACGNVAEWVQDFGANSTERGIRGGHWRDSPYSSSVTTSARGSLPADATPDHVGFRLVRGTGRAASVSVTDHLFDVTKTASFIMDLDEPLTVFPETDSSVRWTYGAGVSPVPILYGVRNLAAGVMSVETSADVGWITVFDDLSSASGGETLRTDIVEGTVEELGITVGQTAEILPPGTHRAKVRFVNPSTGTEQSRTVTAIVDRPVRAETDPTVFAEFSGLPGGPFLVGVGTPAEASVLRLTLENSIDQSVGYQLASTAEWLTMNPIGLGTGTLPGAPHAPLEFQISTSSEANSLPPGEYSSSVRVSVTLPSGSPPAVVVEVPVKLVVERPLKIDQAADPWVVSIDSSWDGGTIQQSYLLENQAAQPVEVSICADESWLATDPVSVELFAGEVATVTVVLGGDVSGLGNGEYRGRVMFEELNSGARRYREVELSVNRAFSVRPGSSREFVGRSGGAVQPLGIPFSISDGVDDLPLDWQVRVQYPAGGPSGWIRTAGGPPTVGGAPSGMVASGTLNDGATISLMLTVDSSATSGLPAGTYSANVLFDDLTHGLMESRSVTLTLSVPLVAVDESRVDRLPLEPNGPDYSYSVSRFPVTNEEFAAFLNDSLHRLDQPAGAFVFVDTTTGDVYINDMEVGASGPDPEGRTILMFSPGASPGIVWDGTTYTVVLSPSDFSRHPVTGVSWYGALKYCNWLTLDQGMRPVDRCYREGSAWTPTAWRPISITEASWTVRDLLDAERSQLVSTCPGYRLAMDDGASNVPANEDRPDGFNEWYKVSAWNPGTGLYQVYGFGRDLMVTGGPLAGGDANYRCSGDRFEDLTDCLIGGTTPVGSYDGSAAIGSTTIGNDNAYGVFDLTGNVHEWVQDRYVNGVSGLSFRTIRGGSWDDAANSSFLRTDRRTFAAAGAVDWRIGFRVVRAIPEAGADADSDGDVDATDFLFFLSGVAGPMTAPQPGWEFFDLDGDGDVDLADFSRLSVGFDP